VHVRSSDRASWDNHGVEGFYLKPVITNYRCWEFYIPTTSRTRISDTVQWLPKIFQLPGSSPLERFEAAFEDLRTATEALKNSNIISALQQQPVSLNVPSAIEKLNLLDNMMNATPNLSQPQRVVTTPPTGEPPRVVTTPALPVDSEPDDIEWAVVHYNKLPVVAQRYFHKVGDTYTDKTDNPIVIWKVIAVAKNCIRTHRVGTPITWYYRVYDTAKFKAIPINIDDCEHISCQEVYKSKNVKWTGIPKANVPSRLRTFAPKPALLRGASSKNSSHYSSANSISNNIEDNRVMHEVIEFRQALQYLTRQDFHSDSNHVSTFNSAFENTTTMFLESGYIADIRPSDEGN